MKTRPARAAFSRLKLGNRLTLILSVAVVALALLGPVFSPHSPVVPIGAPFQPPGHGAFLGTDEVGRDVLTRVLYGMRLSLVAALAVITSGVLFGSLVGLVAGASGGWVDALLSRFTDSFLALPGPVLAIAVVAALGPGLTHTLIAVAIVWWPLYARIVRAEIRRVASLPHVEAARIAGVRGSRLWLRHLLPAAVPSILVAVSLDVGALILMLAALSFLGLGAPQPAPELGSMTADGYPYLLFAWWTSVFPALALFLLSFLANLSGDAIRDMISER